MLKPKSLPQNSITEILSRIQDEVNASYFYEAARNFARANGYKIAESYFENERQDELRHAKGLIDFLVDYNVKVTVPTPTIKPVFANLIDIHEQQYTMENDLRAKYNSTASNFMTWGDLTSFNKALVYVSIQDESTIQASDILNLLDGCDTSKQNLLLLQETIYGE